MRELHIVRGRLTPATKQESDYLLIPFDVPPGMRRLEVKYTYEKHGGETVVDLGLFDARGATFLQAAGFRGWSGSERDHVVLTEESATPGYLPGPILPGRWHVVLGVYKVAAKGSDYEVEIRMSNAPGVPPYSPPRPLPSVASQRAGPLWLRGDLHCHTHHSDGKASVAELATIAQERGLDFVAVTDHNTISHHPYLPAASDDRFTLIPGEEVTTYYGHANVWGVNQWVDFRCRTPEDVRAAFLWAQSRGGVISINHPKAGGPPWEFGYDVPFTCMEVWHGYPHYNHEPLGVWERLLQQGRRIVGVGGSDTHLLPPPAAREFPIRLGRPTTYVWAETNTVDAILAGIRQGRVVISCDVDGPRMEMTLHLDGRTFHVGQTLSVSRGQALTVEIKVHEGRGGILEIVHDGQVVESTRISKDDVGHTMRIKPVKSGYVRAQIRAEEGDPRVWSSLPLLALTNPVYIHILEGD